MTERFENVVQKIGRVRKLILILLATFLGVTLLLDILVVETIFDPLVYLYIALGTIIALYVIQPLYTGRRLVQYYWQRVKRNRLAVGGLAFILFLILLAVIGPFFTADPTAVNFEEKNHHHWVSPSRNQSMTRKHSNSLPGQSLP